MASIQQRINKNGTKVWRAIIRIKGYPTVCDHFDRKQEAQDWANDIERQIKLGKYNFGKQDQKKTVSDLIDRYIADGALEHHKAAKDTRRHLEYFKSTIGDYALTFITPELLLDERKKLLETTSTQGTPRTPATVNRYFSSLSGALRYACKNLRWVDENSCANLLKLKENSRKRRVLTSDEEIRLLEAEKAEKEAKELMLFMAGGPRMDHGVKISEVTREGGYDYKTFCDIMISEEMLEPYKKPDSKYMKVTLY